MKKRTGFILKPTEIRHALLSLGIPVLKDCTSGGVHIVLREEKDLYAGIWISANGSGGSTITSSNDKYFIRYSKELSWKKISDIKRIFQSESKRLGKVKGGGNMKKPLGYKECD